METGIKGWVRNIPDGRVEIRAEGNREALLDFRRKIEIGPPSGSVRDVASEEGEVEHFVEFKIIG
jgi:acylphosphatase